MTRQQRLILIFCICLAARELPGQTSTERIVSGLNRPVFATAPQGDDNRLFVVEQNTGAIRVVDLQAGAVQQEPFLTVSGLSTGGERGLLGLAFHPDYLQNGKLYLYASQPGGGQHHSSHVWEYTVENPATSNVATATQKSIMRFDQPFGNHNGGWIGFDPTAVGEARNYLYIATGDGGSGGDPQNNSQDITRNFLGKILRIDPTRDDFASSVQNYAVPSSNPFVNEVGDDEIWAYGLRNPWRNGFDRATGDLWIGDVGQRQREEIHVLPSDSSGGENFGWRVMEGNNCFDPGDSRDGNPPCNDPSFVPPVYDYRHGNGTFQGDSVTGGYLYRGPVREFQGHYFFGDFASSHVWTLDPFTHEVTNQRSALRPDVGRVSQISSFAEDNRGELYILSYGSGSLHRLTTTSRDARWTGVDPEDGVAGDGVDWEQAANWNRDGVSDTPFIDGDHLILAGQDLATSQRRRVSAISFEADAVFAIDAVLDIVSENIDVAEGVEGTLRVQRLPDGIRKTGGGNLRLHATDIESTQVALLDGSTQLTQAELPTERAWLKVGVVAGASLEVVGDQGIGVRSLEIAPGASLVATPGSPLEPDATLAEALAGTAVLADALALGGAFIAHLPEGFEFPAVGDVARYSLVHGVRRDELEPTSMLVNDSEPGHQGNGLFVTLDWEMAQNNGQFLYLTTYSAIPGDTNGDQLVNFDDFLFLSAGFGSEGDWESGDFNGNGMVENDDFLLLSANYGRTASVATVAAIPEPNAAWIAMWIPLAALCRRRRLR